MVPSLRRLQSVEAEGSPIRKRPGAPGGRREHGVLRAGRPSWVPPRGGRDTEAAACQEHVKQQQLEEQQPQRPQPQRRARRPCGEEGEPVRGPEAGPQPAPAPPGESSAFFFRSPNPGKVLPGV